MIRILLADDHTLVRRGVRLILEQEPDLSVVAEAADGTPEAMERPGDRFCVAVQWHPETAADVGLLAGLVRAAAGGA